ncbi:hypothetical protein BCV71DRAFT_235634 [Rhizopus microsporus]|uniref:Uncharacterized protein n=1 Tax=Rhizopus microsporus TaxID=58291 RepID=A0A1X0S036_RHIZD|nr:hypothetical protein BCV71DRAFT_235634 [Rhizopus microsporus]
MFMPAQDKSLEYHHLENVLYGCLCDINVKKQAQFDNLFRLCLHDYQHSIVSSVMVIGLIYIGVITQHTPFQRQFRFAILYTDEEQGRTYGKNTAYNGKIYNAADKFCPFWKTDICFLKLPIIFPKRTKFISRTVPEAQAQ